jgi:hypothetical protein
VLISSKVGHHFVDRIIIGYIRNPLTGELADPFVFKLGDDDFLSVIQFINNDSILAVTSDEKLITTRWSNSNASFPLGPKHLALIDNQNVLKWDLLSHPPTMFKSDTTSIFNRFVAWAHVADKGKMRLVIANPNGGMITTLEKYLDRSNIVTQLGLDEAWEAAGIVYTVPDEKKFLFTLKNKNTDDIRLFEINQDLDAATIKPWAPHPAASTPHLVLQGNPIPLNAEDLHDHGAQTFDLRSPLIVSPDGKTAFINTYWKHRPKGGAEVPGAAVLRAERNPDTGELFNLEVFRAATTTNLFFVHQWLTNDEIIFVTQSGEIKIIPNRKGLQPGIRLGDLNHLLSTTSPVMMTLESLATTGFARVGAALVAFVFEGNFYVQYRMTDVSGGFNRHPAFGLDDMLDQVNLGPAWKPFGPPIHLEGNDWLLCFKSEDTYKFFRWAESGDVTPYDGPLIEQTFTARDRNIRLSGTQSVLPVLAMNSSNRPLGLYELLKGRLLKEVKILGGSSARPSANRTPRPQQPPVLAETSLSLSTLLSAPAVQLPGMTNPMT